MQGFPLRTISLALLVWFSSLLDPSATLIVGVSGVGTQPCGRLSLEVIGFTHISHGMSGTSDSKGRGVPEKLNTMRSFATTPPSPCS